eukprot:2949079-Rhodomonas_salina.3
MSGPKQMSKKRKVLAAPGWFSWGLGEGERSGGSMCCRGRKKRSKGSTATHVTAFGEVSRRTGVRSHLVFQSPLCVGRWDWSRAAACQNIRCVADVCSRVRVAVDVFMDSSAP